MSIATPREMEWMPTIEQYMALAKAMHEERDDCNAQYVVPFEECAVLEADIEDALRVLVGLRRAGWQLAHDPAGTPGLGL